MNTQEAALAAAWQFQQSGVPYALVSVVRAVAPASARPGDKAVVTAEGAMHGWIGGGCAQPTVLRTVRQVLADGQARLIRITPNPDGEVRELGDVLEFGMSCHSGGTLELFVDPILPRPQLVVIGASPVGASLVRLAPQLGFCVTLVGHEIQAASHPEAQRVLTSDDPANTVPEIAPGAWVVIATQGRRDMQGLRLALALRARQIAFVASARKAAVLKEALIAAGEKSEAVHAIVAPAGYPIDAETPEEIALSVLAALVAARRARAKPLASAALDTGVASRPGPASLNGPAAPDAPAPAIAPLSTEAVGLPAMALPLPGGKPSCCGGS